MIKDTIKKLIKNPGRIFIILSYLGFFKGMDDRKYLEKVYKIRTGKDLDLDDPKSFNEKIQWLKLYDRKPEYTTMVDKYAVKKYVAEKIGEQYIIPDLGVWDRFDDIDLDKLPDKFVLKCTHDSSGVVICKDKSKFDIAAARKMINKRLKVNYFYFGREYAYKNVKPRIIAEKFMEDPEKPVPEDYKIYCINGEPVYIVVFHDRFNKQKAMSETVYNTDWEPQHISLNEHFAVSDETEPKPECLDELLDITRVLCRDMAQVRIDFYIIENRIYFGEITLYAANGFQKMIPEELNLKLGQMLTLPEKKVQ